LDGFSQKIYIFISLSWAFFENRKNSGLTPGQNDDPVTRTWKMAQMTHWPGDPITQLHMSGDYQLSNQCPIYTARQTRQDGPVCVVSGGVNWVGPTNAFCVGVRPAVALRRPTHSDTDQTQNAPVWRSGRLNSYRHATKQSCQCRVWRGGVNWTIVVSKF